MLAQIRALPGTSSQRAAQHFYPLPLLKLHTSILNNAGWLLADRLVRMGTGLVVGAAVARHLGPSTYGTLGYALAAISVFQVTATLGLDSIAVRELARSHFRPEAVLGTLARLRAMATGIALVAGAATLFWLAPFQHGSLLSVVLVLGLLFGPWDIIDLRFQSQLRSREVVIARGSAFACATLVRASLLLTQAPLAAFVLAILLESALNALALTFLYRSRGADPGWTWDGPLARTMLKSAWPILLSGVTLSLYLQTDKLLVGALAGSHEVGIYLAAGVISGAFTVIPMAFLQSLAPKLATLTTATERIDFLARHGAGMMGGVCLIAAGLVGFAEPIIRLIFGQEYLQSAVVLQVSAASLIFQSLSVLNDYYALSSGKTGATLTRTIAGLIVSVTLYAVLIPVSGATGAAIAALLGHLISNTLAVWFALPETRQLHRRLLTQLASVPFRITRIYR